MESKKTYSGEVQRAMEILARDERVIFLGQTVGCPGSRFTYKTLEKIDLKRRIELPVMEETQMGMSIGLSLGRYIPVSIYPRFDFLLLAANQLVNHLDKAEEMSRGQYKPKVIIKTIIGSKTPLYPGPQHCQEYTDAFKLMLKNVYVKKLDRIEEIVEEYQKALKREQSSLFIEIGESHLL